MGKKGDRRASENEAAMKDESSRRQLQGPNGRAKKGEMSESVP